MKDMWQQNSLDLNCKNKCQITEKEKEKVSVNSQKNLLLIYFTLDLL